MLNWMNELLQNFLSMVLQILPTSPFQQYIQIFKDLPYLSTLNWFFPIADMITVGVAWLGAISVFYIYSIIMRWIKLIGD